MNEDQIAAASDALGWLIEQSSAPGEEGQKRAEMTLHLIMARTYLTDYCVHISRGMEPYDALMATARGELALSPSQRDLARALIPRGLQPD